MVVKNGAFGADRGSWEDRVGWVFVQQTKDRTMDIWVLGAIIPNSFYFFAFFLIEMYFLQAGYIIKTVHYLLLNNAPVYKVIGTVVCEGAMEGVRHCIYPLCRCLS